MPNMNTADLRIVPLDDRSIDLLPLPCAACVYWEDPKEFATHPAQDRGSTLKREWIRERLQAAGKGYGGFVALLAGVPVGFCQFSTEPFFPRVSDYESGPPSPDSLFVACLYVLPGAERRGIGRELLNFIEDEADSRGLQAVETLARDGSADNPSGPAEFWRRAGYQVVREKGGYALMRKDAARKSR